MNKDKKYLIVIVGPTAIGKTSLAIKLANYFCCEILSADSRQFFKEMEIGTAKPTKEELMSAKHHFVDFLSVKDKYTAGMFEKDAIKKLSSIYKKNNVAIMVGGSGLYINAVCNGIDEIPSDDDIRNKLNDELNSKGIEYLQNKLEDIDPVIWKTINQKNPQRIIRALEVYNITGKPYSEFRKGKPKEREFKTIKIGLNSKREDVYSNINNRVDIMVQQGLVEEARSLQNYKMYNALNTVGYKEMFKYFNNEISLNEAIELIKKNTRNFAKRQLTWFRKDKDIEWFNTRDTENITQYINSFIT